MDLTSYTENPATLTVNYSCFFEKLLRITYRIKHDLPIKCQAIHLGASDNAIWMALSLDYSFGVQYSLLIESKRQNIKKKKKDGMWMIEGVKGDVADDIWKYSLQHFLNSKFS